MTTIQITESNSAADTNTQLGTRLSREMAQIGRLHRQEVHSGQIKSESESFDGLTYVELKKFALPVRWSYNGARECPLYILVSDEYPNVAPKGFLLPASLQGSLRDDLDRMFKTFDQVDLLDDEHSVPEPYLSLSVDMGRWVPKRNAVGKGDDLMRYATIVFLMLGQPPYSPR